jgi:AcrR family transcriptional regulator
MAKIRQTSRDLQAAERRQQILDVAKRLFAERGYHATSIRELNKEVGVADSLTYHYFPGGKLQILNTLVEEEQWKFNEKKMELFFDHNISLREALILYMETVYEVFQENKEIYQIVLRENHLFETERWIELFQSSQKFSEIIIQLLYSHQRNGNIRDMNVEMAFAQFSAQIKLSCLHSTMTGVDFSKDHIGNLEEIVDFTLKLWAP